MLKTLKNCLINSRAQSIVEYSVIFIAFALAVAIFITKTREGFEVHFQNAVNYILK
jgi:hypothetical protein